MFGEVETDIDRIICIPVCITINISASILKTTIIIQI